MERAHFSGKVSSYLHDVKQGTSVGFVAVYGEELFKLDQFIAEVQTALGRSAVGSPSNVVPMDVIDCSSSSMSAAGDNDPLAQIFLGLQSVDLFSKANTPKLVVAENVQSLRSLEKLFDRLRVGIDGESKRKTPSLSSTSLRGQMSWCPNQLILKFSAWDGRRKFNSWLNKQGLALEFKSPEVDEVVSCIYVFTQQRGCSIAEDAARWLALNGPVGLYEVQSEVEKLTLYVNSFDRSEINADDVMLLCTGSREHEMVELVEAVIAGRKARALVLSEQVLRTADQIHGFIGFLTWAMRNPSSALGSKVRVNRRLLLQSLEGLDLKLKTAGSESKIALTDFILSSSVA